MTSTSSIESALGLVSAMNSVVEALLTSVATATALSLFSDFYYKESMEAFRNSSVSSSVILTADIAVLISWVFLLHSEAV